ncbi:Uncharacterized protein HZ326_18170 [Fusarium oxysporum f. sp. albedinis]|nr:Uncharacterized protein HZ326_18170 [Fusarium oxysporum f. sp. albedinis]
MPSCANDFRPDDLSPDIPVWVMCPNHASALERGLGPGVPGSHEASTADQLSTISHSSHHIALYCSLCRIDTMIFPNKGVHPVQGSQRTFPFVRSGPERDSGHGKANGGGGRFSIQTQRYHARLGVDDMDDWI